MRQWTDAGLENVAFAKVRDQRGGGATGQRSVVAQERDCCGNTATVPVSGLVPHQPPPQVSEDDH